MGYKVAGGNIFTRSFPYAAAAVLASRRYARPAAKWRARRAVGVTTRLRAARSRTTTVRRRKRRTKATRRGRARRRGLFNMSPLGRRLVRFKDITEITYGWKLTNAGTVTSPQRIQNMHSKWMAPPKTNETPEALFDSYKYKRLKKYSYKITNFRIFLETITTTKASGSPMNAPAVTDTQIAELNDWVFWYWRLLASGNTQPPAKEDESRYTKFCRKNCQSAIRGYVPLPSKTMAWINEDYTTAFNTTSGTYNNLDNYLGTVIHSGTYGPVTGAGNVPSPDIFIMPDDPYPSSFFPGAGGTIERIVNLTVVADVQKYATWELKCPRAS